MAQGYVRTAREDEAGVIARIQLATWREAYTRIVPPAVLADLDEAAITRQWAESITGRPSPHHHVLVAVEQAEELNVVGFAAIGPVDAATLAPDDDPDEVPAGTGAVIDLLVEPRWGRRGHGSRLLSAAVDLWRADGNTRALAWVFERDAASRALLTSTGWEPDGAVRALDMAGTLVRQTRLHVAFDAAD